MSLRDGRLTVRSIFHLAYPFVWFSWEESVEETHALTEKGDKVILGKTSLSGWSNQGGNHRNCSLKLHGKCTSANCALNHRGIAWLVNCAKRWLARATIGRSLWNVFWICHGAKCCVSYLEQVSSMERYISFIIQMVICVICNRDSRSRSWQLARREGRWSSGREGSRPMSGRREADFNSTASWAVRATVTLLLSGSDPATLTHLAIVFKSIKHIATRATEQINNEPQNTCSSCYSKYNQMRFSVIYTANRRNWFAKSESSCYSSNTSCSKENVKWSREEGEKIK